jgi:hypothetical protein
VAATVPRNNKTWQNVERNGLQSIKLIRQGASSPLSSQGQESCALIAPRMRRRLRKKRQNTVLWSCRVTRSHVPNIPHLFTFP